MNRSLPAMLDIWQTTFSWHPSDRQILLFSQLYEAVLKGNQTQNLTRITEPEEFWEKHIWDSFLGIAPFLIADYSLPTLQGKVFTKAKIIDIGTGAGFPGLPIATVNPHWSITMVDSTQKKVAFVSKAIAQLQLERARAIVSRAETLGKNQSHREQYDLALIRAVARPSVCAEYILPFVKVGGFGVLYRGHWQEGDTIALESAVKQLGSEIRAIEQTITPLSFSIRHCIYLYKHSPISNKFPRSVGVPDRQPL